MESESKAERGNTKIIYDAHGFPLELDQSEADVLEDLMGVGLHFDFHIAIFITHLGV